jgi:hypothetical protein
MEHKDMLALGQALIEAEGIAMGIYRSAPSADIDPAYWKRLRSTAFACEKQRKLMEATAIEEHGKPLGLSMDKQETPTPFDYPSFQKLATMLSGACKMAIGGGRIKSIRESLMKQIKLLNGPSILHFGKGIDGLPKAEEKPKAEPKLKAKGKGKRKAKSA